MKRAISQYFPFIGEPVHNLFFFPDYFFIKRLNRHNTIHRMERVFFPEKTNRKLFPVGFFVSAHTINNSIQ